MAITYGALQTLGIAATDAYLRGLHGVTQSVAQEIATEYTMKAETIEAPIVGMVGPLRKWVGAREIETIKWCRYSVTAEKFEKTLGIDRDKLEADDMGLHQVALQTLGTQVGLWKDQQCAAKLELGETALCYDGKAFFADDHPVEYGNTGAGTFDNLIGSGGTAPWYLFDTSMPLKPMTFGVFVRPEFTNRWNPEDPNVFDNDQYLSGVRCKGVADYGLPHMAVKHKGTLNSTNFDAAVAAMRSRKNAAGESLGAKGTLLVVPGVLEQVARNLFGQDYLASGESNIHKNAIRWVVWDRLSDS